MKEYIKQMQLLAIEWDQFIKKSFPDEIAEFNENKKIKYQIFDLIVEITDDATLPPKKQKNLIKESILFLAKTSGCAEDMEIAESILDELEDKNYINKVEIELFYNNSSLGRWT